MKFSSISHKIYIFSWDELLFMIYKIWNKLQIPGLSAKDDCEEKIY